MLMTGETHTPPVLTSRAVNWDSLAAHGLLVALPLQLPGLSSATVGSLLALLILPVLSSELRVSAQARKVIVCSLIAAASGALLALVQVAFQFNSRIFSIANSLTSTVFLAGLLVQALAVMWCCTKVSLTRVGTIYGASAALNAVIYTSGSNAENLWKYGLAFPVCLLILSAASRVSALVVFPAAAVLVVVSFGFDTRNVAGALVLTLISGLLASRLPGQRGKGHFALVAALLLVATVATYLAVDSAAESGALGRDLQETALAQERSGAVIAGRVEYGATFALMASEPLGLGPGVIPSPEDIQVGKSGLKALGVGTSSEYVDGDMFDGRFEVHSVAGDLWVQFGVGGLVLAAAMVLVLLSTLKRAYEGLLGTITVVALFVAFQAGWDVLFSPLYANYRSVGACLGICLALNSGMWRAQEQDRKYAV